MARLFTFLGATTLAFMLLGGAILVIGFVFRGMDQGRWLVGFFIAGGWALVPLASGAFGIWAALQDDHRPERP